VRALVVVILAFDLAGATAANVLARLDQPLRPPVASQGAGTGSFPVVLVAGLESDGTSFTPLIAALEAQGTPVIDFDPQRAGPQPLTWHPSSPAQHLPSLAADVIQPAIDAAVARAGYDPATQRLDVVAHSLGGLAARFLIEHPGGAVEPTWGARVDDLVMVATPNHGSSFGAWFAQLGPTSSWEALADDFRPGSGFLQLMGTREPAGEVYTTIGGSTWAMGFLRSDDDGDGTSHGHDGVVPAESPAMQGAPLTIEPRSHGRLLRSPRVIARILATLRAGAG
jgi:hypothetical protein